MTTHRQIKALFLRQACFFRAHRCPALCCQEHFGLIFFRSMLISARTIPGEATGSSGQPLEIIN
jgi:hypothetical protein